MRQPLHTIVQEAEAALENNSLAQTHAQLPTTPLEALNTLSLFFLKSFGKEIKRENNEIWYSTCIYCLEDGLLHFSLCQKYVLIVTITTKVQLNKVWGKGRS